MGKVKDYRDGFKEWLSDYPDLVTGVYIDGQGRKWFCVRRDNSMDCSGSDSSYTSAFLSTFNGWGWKLTKDQTY